MAKREEIRKKIEARQAEKQAAVKAKYAKMRQVADGDAGSVEKDLQQLADSCSAQAEAFENLKENLDLISAPKEASLRVRVAAARKYAAAFKRIAEEAPEQLAAAVCEAYHSLDEQAGALENLANTLGIDLQQSPAEEGMAQEGINQLDGADEAGFPVGDVEEKEAAGGGSDAWVTDRDESGQPKKPEQVEVPRVANSGPGGAGFVTDRNKDAQPEAPAKMEIPQAQGKTEVGRAAAAASGEPAAAFVKDIPQAQGKSETKSGAILQEVGGGHAAQPAGEFVSEIPQAKGQGQTPGNKSGSRLRVVKRK